MVNRKFKVGDRAKWKAAGGTAGEKGVRVIEESGRLGNLVYAASKGDPRYVVQTDQGAMATHAEEALRGTQGVDRN